MTMISVCWPTSTGGSHRSSLSYDTKASALESVFVATANALEEEMTFSRKLAQQLLADLEDNIDRDNLKRLLHYSRRIMGFQSRARYVKRAVDEVLESGESDPSFSWLVLNRR